MRASHPCEILSLLQGKLEPEARAALIEKGKVRPYVLLWGCAV